jgi:hypothetical protein
MLIGPEHSERRFVCMACVPKICDGALSHLPHLAAVLGGETNCDYPLHILRHVTFGLSQDSALGSEATALRP